MARARNIKPGLFRNEVLGVADPLYTLLFQGLWLLADREGRLEDRPLRIKADIFPYREGINTGAMLGWLVDAGFIQRYQCGGLALIQILNFTKHQNPHKNEPESSYGAPEELGATPEKIGSAPADSGSRIPDSGYLTADTPTPAAPPPPVAAAPAPVPASVPAQGRKKAIKTAMPDGFGVSDRVKAWAQSKGFGQLDQHFEAFARKAKANGYTYADWDSAFMEAVREDWAKLRGRAFNGAAPPPESGGAPDPDSQPAVEAEGLRLGLGKWSQTEQWPAYLARVRARQRAEHSAPAGVH